ncbi:MAG: hypothetical protein EOM03_06805 [Clostridia bacterium]|nr:hypothetical protein [Clostridia bacterium]NCC83821.1 hypothetical protein [Clostridia bacterium]
MSDSTIRCRGCRSSLHFERGIKYKD